MISPKFITIFCVGALIACVRADSAGVVEMPDGLAYGGIPYGSVSGMLAKYQKPVAARNYYQELNQYPYPQRPQPQASLPIIVTPNFRAAGLAARSTGPVQIYKLPGVIAPGVVGTFVQIGY
ncbi:uncharacterized protein LOC107048243 [Diachasma alloeum]|uniref:uncharacterized protein LOC107048243 n=1 Tax=Diachasma alloeum TaxID=454923 RepID=UPI0007383594|nr:uncharacterized protein LOC107048243 [Diachasma alloeum]